MGITNNEKMQAQDDFIMLPKVDFCFKELMQSDKVRKGVIAAVLNMDPEEIESTELMPTILQPDYPDDKYGVLDVRVKMRSGVQLNFEMQLTSYDYWTNRILFYWSKMFVEQIKKGQGYDALRPCIHVSILDFVHFKEDSDCGHKVGLCNEETGDVYSDLLQFYIFELPKLPPEDQNESGIIQWMRFFNGEKREDFEKMADQNEYMGEAYECLKKLSADEIKRIEYERRQKCILDHNSMITAAAERAAREAAKEATKEATERTTKIVTEKAAKEEQLKFVQRVVKKIYKGCTAEEAADMLEEDAEMVQRVYKVAEKYAPEYDVTKICEETFGKM